MCVGRGPLTDTLRNLFMCSLPLHTHPELGLAATRWDSVEISLSQKLLEEKPWPRMLQVSTTSSALGEPRLCLVNTRAAQLSAFVSSWSFTCFAPPHTVCGLTYQFYGSLVVDYGTNFYSLSRILLSKSDCIFCVFWFLIWSEWFKFDVSRSCSYSCWLPPTSKARILPLHTQTKQRYHSLTLPFSSFLNHHENVSYFPLSSHFQ